MALRSIRTTGNVVSMSFTWAKAVRPSRKVLEDMCDARESPFFKKPTTASGAFVLSDLRVVKATKQ